MKFPTIHYPSILWVAACIVLYLCLSLQPQILLRFIPVFGIAICTVYEGFNFIASVMKPEKPRWVSRLFLTLSFLAILYFIMMHMRADVLGGTVDL